MLRGLVFGSGVWAAGCGVYAAVCGPDWMGKVAVCLAVGAGLLAMLIAAITRDEEGA